ncbi:Protein-glutamine gamma-glutamyltransferase K [Triplophysa tibetana]|uniref:Protein-glutamine gamma-glutamyltransferase K n=1 Tax=Triplophysa tibetana TaxID=1572043 RepID=A0A5A9N1C5_9TELE|nr:Protein-glutamine gamma-glutamyltransferase K [Triplophysa tibetana]
MSVAETKEENLERNVSTKHQMHEETDEKWTCGSWIQQFCLHCCSHIKTDEVEETVISNSNAEGPKGNYEMKGLLETRSIDLLKSKTEQNRSEHHTDRYHNENLVIQRGQTFQMLIELSRPFNPRTDKLHLELRLADSVYMDDVEQKKEYVLNDMGIIYRGTERQIEGKAWNFGQLTANKSFLLLYK